MNPYRALTAEETITQDFEQLSNTRPVRVLTHLFDQLDGTPAPVSGIETEICGRAYRIQDRPEVAAHDHDHYEIGLVISGKALHRTAMYESVLKRGTVVIVAPGKVHGICDIDGLCIVNCIYLTEWLLHDVRDIWTLEGLVPLFLASGLMTRSDNPWIPQYQLTDEEYLACLQEMRDMGREWDRDEPSRIYMKCSIEKLMLTLGRAFTRTGLGQTRLAVQSEMQSALEQIEDHVANCRVFRVADLAERIGMSPDYFSRVFKEVTGWSPMDYFQRRRIQHASWLLLNANRSVTEVAHALGFFDSAHFSRLFKRHQGLSPRAYRKRYRTG